MGYSNRWFSLWVTFIRQKYTLFLILNKKMIFTRKKGRSHAVSSACDKILANMTGDYSQNSELKCLLLAPILFCKNVAGVVGTKTHCFETRI